MVLKAAGASGLMRGFLPLLRRISRIQLSPQSVEDVSTFSEQLRFSARALSAVIKLLDGGAAKGKLFADAGVQLNGIQSCLKMLKWPQL